MSSKIYEVRAESGGRVHSFGARRSRKDAEELLATSDDRVRHVGGHNDRYWIEEIDTTGLFRGSQPTHSARAVHHPRPSHVTRRRVAHAQSGRAPRR